MYDLPSCIATVQRSQMYVVHGKAASPDASSAHSSDLHVNTVQCMHGRQLRWQCCTMARPKLYVSHELVQAMMLQGDSVCMCFEMVPDL